MLYRTTRGKHDVVTAFKTVHTDCYVDGGLFLPFRMPKLNTAQTTAMGNTSATQTVANVLNELFGCSLTAWDVEIAIGRKPVRLATVGRQIVAGELWHNERDDVSAMVKALSERIGGGKEPTNWMEIAVRIALLFASYAQIQSGGGLKGQQKLDVAVATGDFTMVMAAWYCREMGLPIGNIICGCNANGGFWDLMNHGELSTSDRAVSTSTPEADLILPRNLERLIHGVFGVEECKRYLLYCSKGRTYTLSPEQVQALSRGLYTAVISDSRIAAIIPGVYRTRSYILSPYGALAYGSLQDFRSTTGEENLTLLIADRSPVKDSALVSRLLKIKEADLRKRVVK